MRIKNKISLFFFTPFFLLMAVIIFMVGWLSFYSLMDKSIALLQLAAESYTEHIDTYLSQNIERFKLISSRTQLRKLIANYNSSPDAATLAEITKIIQDAKQPIEEFERLCIINLDGTVIASTNSQFVGRNVVDKDFFIGGREDDGVYFVEEDGVYKIFVSGPIVLDGQLTAVGISVVSIDKLSNIVKSVTGLGQTGEVTVAFMGADGLRKYPISRRFDYQSLSPQQESAKTAQPMKEALAGKEAVFVNDLDYRNQKVLAVSKYIDNFQLGLVAKIDSQEIMSVPIALILLLVVIFLASLVVYYFIVRFLSWRLTLSISKLNQGAKEIGRGNWDYRVKLKDKDEIGELSRTFNKMAQEVRKSRAEVDRKVEQQTKEIEHKNKSLENEQKAMFNVLEDVEEEKEKTKVERDKIDAILHSIGDGVFVVDKDLKITIYNDISAKLSGFGVEEAIGKRYDRVLKFIFEDDGQVNDSFIKQAIKTGEIQEMANHTLLIRKDGSRLPVADSAAPIRNTHGKIIGCVVVFRDVTKEREVDKMKTEFVSVASHQLRTPLTAIRWTLEELAGGELGRLNDQQQDYVNQSLESSERMMNLVNDLLNVSRLETGRLSVEPKPTDLAELVGGVIREYQPVAKAKKCRIIFNTSKPKLKKINIDSSLIRQVVTNFISNGVKYSPVAKDSVVSVSLSANKQEVIFSVKDSGVGIPKTAQSRIFEKFFRADNVVKMETEGSGLGLYISKMIIEISGGRLWFESQEGKGSTFYFSLPLSGSKKIKGEKGLAG